MPSVRAVKSNVKFIDASNFLLGAAISNPKSDQYSITPHPHINNNIMTNIFIVAAKRTPFGSFGGSLKALTATELGVVSTKSAIKAAGCDPSTIDAVYFGNVIQSSSDAAYLARHVGLKCGVPVAAPALTINRLCGSGFETVIQGAKSIRLGEARIVVCGGSENMSMAPLQVDGNDARWGVSLGTGLTMRDSLWDG
jgi:acetyl-CoA acyltransferase 2